MRLFALAVAVVSCLMMFAATEMSVILNDGTITKYKVLDVKEVVFDEVEDDLIPEVPLVVDESETPLKFEYYEGLMSMNLPWEAKVIRDDSYKSLETIVIPQNVRKNDNVYEVYKIDGSAFGVCDDLKKIVIPNSVLFIGEYAFYSAKNLDVIIDISEELKVGNGAFSGVKSLSYINYDASMVIDANATPLDFKILSDSTVEVIKDYYSYKNLTSVIVPAKVRIDKKVYKVTSIGESAFAYSKNLVSVTLPYSLTNIKESAFLNCESLTKINLPSSIVSIGVRAFYNCSVLDGIVLPQSLTELGTGAFSKCVSLTSVKIPSGVINVNDDIFEDCIGLENVEIPEGVEAVGYAFSGCKKLTTLNIPSSAKVVWAKYFYDCSSLTSINVAEGNPNYSSVEGVLYNKDITEIIRVPQGLNGEFVIPSTVTEIGENAFYECIGLTSVVIPSSVETIEMSAFRKCSGLANMNIPSSVTNIQSVAFEKCTGLTSITIPSSVFVVGTRAFSECENLDVVIDNSKDECKHFSSDAFNGCKSVTWLK